MRHDTVLPQQTGGRHESGGRLGFAWSVTLVAIVAAIPTLFIFLSTAPLRIFAFAVLILAAVLGLVILRNSKQFLLALLVAGTGIGIDFYFVFHYTPQFHSATGYFFHIIFFPMAILIVRWLWMTSQGKATFSLRRRGLLPLALFTVFALLSVTQSPQPEFSWFELFGFAQCVLIYLIMTEVLQERQDVYIFCISIAAAVGVEGLIAALQYLTGTSLGLDFIGETKHLSQQLFAGEGFVRRASGTLSYPNSLALYIDLLAPMVFGLALVTRQAMHRAGLAAAALLGVVGVVVTVSRGGILATGMSLFLMTCYVGFRTRRAGRYIVVFALVVAIIFIGIVSFDNPLRTRLFQSNDASARSRGPMMDVAERMISAHLFEGVGLNNYTLVAPSYDSTANRISLIFPFPVHNIFLLLLAEVGIFGFLAMMLFIVTVLYKGLRLGADRNIDIGVIGFGLTVGLLAYFLHGQVDYDYLTANFTFWVVTGAIAGLWRLRRFSNENQLPDTA